MKPLGSYEHLANEELSLREFFKENVGWLEYGIKSMQYGLKQLEKERKEWGCSFGRKVSQKKLEEKALWSKRCIDFFLGETTDFVKPRYKSSTKENIRGTLNEFSEFGIYTALPLAAIYPGVGTVGGSVASASLCLATADGGNKVYLDSQGVEHALMDWAAEYTSKLLKQKGFKEEHSCIKNGVVRGMQRHLGMNLAKESDYGPGFLEVTMEKDLEELKKVYLWASRYNDGFDRSVLEGDTLEKLRIRAAKDNYSEISFGNAYMLLNEGRKRKNIYRKVLSGEFKPDTTNTVASLYFT